MNNPVLNYLNSHKINYKLHSHEPVLTVEQAKLTRTNIPGMHCKNLFLMDKRTNQYYLLTTPADKIFELKKIRTMIGAKSLSFAKPEALQSLLGVELGAVSPFGLMNDIKKEIIYILDKEVWNAEIVTFHPNINTMTLELRNSQFKKYLETLETKIITLHITERIQG